MARRTKVPTIQQVKRGLTGPEGARERMQEVLWSLRYLEPKPSVSFSRELLELALLPQLDEKSRQRLVVASARGKALTEAYRKVFDASDSAWVRSAVLDSLSDTVSDAYFDLLRRYVPKGAASRTILPAFDRMRGAWKRLLAEPVHLSVASAIGNMVYSDLRTSGELSADEGAVVSEFLASTALREMPALEAAQLEQPFFWFDRKSYSHLAAQVTPLLQPLGFLPPCEASREVLERAVLLADPYLRVAGVVSSLRLSYPVPLEVLRRAAQFPATRPELFAALQDGDLRAQLAEFETPSAWAEGELAAWLASPWELTRAPYELELQGERAVATELGQAHLFAFRFRYEPGWRGAYKKDTFALVGLVPDVAQWFAEIDEPLARRSVEAALDEAARSLAERMDHMKEAQEHAKKKAARAAKKKRANEGNEKEPARVESKTKSTRKGAKKKARPPAKKRKANNKGNKKAARVKTSKTSNNKGNKKAARVKTSKTSNNKGKRKPGTSAKGKQADSKRRSD